ncbi:Phenylalanyl-tRNA synthetase, partial [Rhizophagus irregularis]
QEALAKIEVASNLKELNEVRVAYLGKKGPITDLLKGMGKLSPEERPKMGALVNTVRENVTEKLEQK